MEVLLQRTVEELCARRRAVDAEALHVAGAILADVEREGLPAVRRHAERLGDVGREDPLLIGREGLRAALAALDPDDRRVLERVAGRIASFARAQRAALSDLDVGVPGGRGGHRVDPVAVAGCYAPGGRHPLPSSMLMTGVTAVAAGVPRVVAASPRPAPATRAAAAVAGVEVLLAAGGAQAVGALALGIEGLPACDVVAGPGNRFVTAAKQLVFGRAGIDMLAGPSELVVLADATADALTVAADLLAQAEHDDEAVPVLVTTDDRLPEGVDRELVRQLRTLPTAETARAALSNGGVICAGGLDAAARACDALAPEHLQVHVEDPAALLPRLAHYGAAFLGTTSAEVLGDYGAGPNHVLPTGGSARFTGGLSVLTFLRVRTWLRLQPGPATAAVARDAAHLARLEGLEAHARSAELRA